VFAFHMIGAALAAYGGLYLASSIFAPGFFVQNLAFEGLPRGGVRAILHYARMAAVAFGMIILLARAGFEAEEIDDFKGLNQRNPWYAGIMAIAMFSLAGVPPLFGFFAKLMVLKAVIDAGQMWLAIVAIVFAIIGLYYYLRVVKVMYFDEPVDDTPLALPNDLAFRWALSINGLALLVLGVVWGPLLDWCTRAFAA